MIRRSSGAVFRKPKTVLGLLHGARRGSTGALRWSGGGRTPAGAVEHAPLAELQTTDGARSTGRPRGGVPSDRARTTYPPASDRRDSGRGPTRSEIAPPGPPAPGGPVGSPSARSAPPDCGLACPRRTARGQG